MSEAKTEKSAMPESTHSKLMPPRNNTVTGGSEGKKTKSLSLLLVWKQSGKMSALTCAHPPSTNTKPTADMTMVTSAKMRKRPTGRAAMALKTITVRATNGWLPRYWPTLVFISCDTCEDEALWADGRQKGAAEFYQQLTCGCGSSKVLFICVVHLPTCCCQSPTELLSSVSMLLQRKHKHPFKLPRSQRSVNLVVTIAQLANDH